METSPATEAEIREALAGKLTAGSGAKAGRQSLGWLSGSAKAKPAAVLQPAPVIEENTVAPPAAPVEEAPPPVIQIIEEIPAPLEPPAEAAVTVPAVVQELPPPIAPIAMPTPPQPVAAVIANDSSPPAALPAVKSPASADLAEQTAKPLLTTIEEWVPLALHHSPLAGKALRCALGNLGPTLVAQVLFVVPFLAVSLREAPLSKFQKFLHNVIPFIALGVVVACICRLRSGHAHLSNQGQGRRPAAPDAAARIRDLAYVPSLAVLALLLAVWLVIGFTVWF